VLAALLALSALLCLAGLNHRPLWNDEAFSYFVAWRGPADALRMIAEDAQPPLYYLALSLWLDLGHDVVVLRGLSALAMVLAVVPFYDGIRRLLGRQTALLAILLWVINPYAVSWAHIARPYPLQTLLVAISFWGFARIWTAPEAEQEPFGRGLVRLLANSGSDRKQAVAVDLAWILYAVGGGLAMLAQHPAGFFVLGCNCAVALRIVADFRRSRRLLLNWSLAQVLLLAVWLIWLPDLLVQVKAHLTPEHIRQQHANYLISAGELGARLMDVFSISYLWRAQPPFVLLYGVLACRGLVHLFRSNRALPSAVLVVAPLLSCLAGFLMLHPVFGYVIYTFVWILPLYLSVVAAGLLCFRPALMAMLLALLLIGNVRGLANYYGTPAAPLDQVGGLIATQMQPGDGIVLSKSGAGRWGIAYYLGAKRQAALAGLDVSDPDGGKLLRSPDQVQTLQRLWVVLPRGEEPAIDLPTLSQQMSLISRSWVGDFLVLQLAR
jgi:4-amino-4-deoxy-L-arabinose transferase-like glycosyltransferase